MLKVGEISTNKSLIVVSGAFIFLAQIIFGTFFTACQRQPGNAAELTKLINSAYPVRELVNGTTDQTANGTIRFYDYYGREILQLSFIEVYKDPEKFRVDLSGEEHRISYAFNGVYAMEKIGAGRAERITSKRFLTRWRVTNFPEQFRKNPQKFSCTGIELVGPDSCYVLRARFKGHETVSYYLDCTSGVLRAYEGRNHFGDGGRLRVEYSKFERINKMMHPCRRTYFLNNRLYKIIDIEQFRHNTGIEDAYFDLSRKLISI